MIDKLEFILALAREEHFGRAAEACGVTQPTLSAGVKQLEEQMGVLLVSRGSRFQGFTPEGFRVLEWARRIVSDSRSMREEINSLRHGLSGRLRIAAIPTALAMVAALTTPYRERYRLLVAADAALGDRETVTWAEVAQVPLCLLTPDMQNRRIIDRALHSVGVEVTPTLTSNSLLVLYTHVKTGRWASVMPAKLAETLGLKDTVRSIPIVDPVVEYSIGLVVPQRDPMTPLIAALVNVAREVTPTLQS